MTIQHPDNAPKWDALRDALNDCGSALLSVENDPSRSGSVYNALYYLNLVVEMQSQRIMSLEQELETLRELVQTISSDLSEVENDFRMAENVRIWGPKQ